MTPPLSATNCRNCHQGPETHGEYSDPNVLFHNPIFPFTSGCSDYFFWGQPLSQPILSRQNDPWWARFNYETTKATAAQFNGVNEIPLKMDIGKGKLAFNLKPDCDQLSMIKSGLDFVCGADASLQGGLEINDNKIPLKMKNILEFKDISLDGPLFIDGTPLKISVGDYGMLHFLAKLDTRAMFFAQSFLKEGFMVPAPPPGYDSPPPEEMAEAMKKGTVRPWRYPDRSKPNFTLDMGLTDFVPKELRDGNGRLPADYSVSLLINRLLDFVKTRPAPDPNKKSDWNLARVLTLFKDGSTIDVSLDDLKDLYLPGKIDLGPSHVKGQVSIRAGQYLDFDFSDFEINFDPMDLPHTEDGSKSTASLDFASIRPGKAFKDQYRIGVDKIDFTYEPGIHATLDSKTNVIDVTVNINLSADMRVPGVNDIGVTAQLLAKIKLVKTENGTQVVPGTTHVLVRNLDIVRPNQPALFRDGEIEITDDGEYQDFLTASAGSWPQKPVTTFRIDGFREKTLPASGKGKKESKDSVEFTPVHVTGKTFPPIDLNGAYLWGDFLRTLSLESDLLIGNGTGEPSTSGRVTIEADPNLNLNALSDSDFIYRGTLDLSKVDPSLKPLQDIVKTGSFLFRSRKVGLSKNNFEGQFLADKIEQHFTGKDGIEQVLVLNGFNSEIEVESLSLSEGVSEIKVPTFHIGANHVAPKEGLVRGPIEIVQENRSDLNKVLAVTWESPLKVLKVEGLDLSLSAQGLYVLPPGLKKMLDPKVASLGIDGHLTGKFTMAFPEDKDKWKGIGDIALRGDPKGDIYWLDASGTQIGPPLIRDTRWRFTKIDKINWKREYALGVFSLDTIVNLQALLPPGSPTSVLPGTIFPKAYSVNGQVLGPYEINGLMNYDNQPLLKSGFQNRIIDYILELCSQNPECRDAASGGNSP